MGIRFQSCAFYCFSSAAREQNKMKALTFMQMLHKADVAYIVLHTRRDSEAFGFICVHVTIACLLAFLPQIFMSITCLLPYCKKPKPAPGMCSKSLTSCARFGMTKATLLWSIVDMKILLSAVLKSLTRDREYQWFSCRNRNVNNVQLTSTWTAAAPKNPQFNTHIIVTQSHVSNHQICRRR